MAAPGAGAAPAAPTAAGPANAQALIAKHAQQTQFPADAAIVARVEAGIKNSPMGWIAGQQAAVDSRASAESSEINGKVAEQRELVAANASKAPPEAGPAPHQGPAAHPAVPHPAPAPSVSAQPKPASGGAPAPHASVPASSAHHGGAPGAATELPAPLAAQLTAVTSDPQLDAILNAYSPKGQESTATLGRIGQMGAVAKGFAGQLDTYVAHSNVVEGAIAATTNFFGAGKEASAVWATNPYRQMHGTLGGIMTGVSAVKNVASTVGSICGKLGLILTIVGLLGMIFLPIGVAVEGVARILNVVGLICDAISFVLGSVLTCLNGVELAKQIASGASAEEKAATADLLMTESQDAAGNFMNLALVFGGGFMKGLLGSSKGVVGSLMKRAKAVIGRFVSGTGNNISAIATKVWRKLGFGGVNAERVAGQWVERPGMFSKVTGVVKAKMAAVPGKIQGWQDGMTARYGSTKTAKWLEGVGASSAAGADRLARFTPDYWATKAGTGLGKFTNEAGEGTAFARNVTTGTERVEEQTRQASMRAASASAGDLETRRWQNTIQDRRDDREVGSVNQATGDAFAARQGARVEASTAATLKAQEPGVIRAENAARTAEEGEEAATAADRKAYSQMNDAQRAAYHAKVEAARVKAAQAEIKYAPDIAKRDRLAAIVDPTPDQKGQLTLVNKRLAKLEEARALRNERDEALARLSGLSGSEEAAGQVRMQNWGDVTHNLWGHGTHIWAAKNDDVPDKRIESGIEWNAKHETVGGPGPEGKPLTVEESRAEAFRDRVNELGTFSRASAARVGVGGRVRTMLSTTGRKPAHAPIASSVPTAPTTAPTAEGPVASTAPTTPAPAHAAQPAPVAVAAAVAVPPSEVAASGQAQGAAAVAAPEPAREGAEGAAPADTADALPYWPAMLPQFEAAAGDFGYMRRVAVEFKKAQIEGKQKAVDTLATYGKFEEYAKLRRAQAQEHAAGAHQTSGETQANQEHAATGATSAGQGEAKQNEAKGQANNRAAVNLPQPTVTSWWDKLLNSIKIWAVNKAAAVFGWIQDQLASLILRGLCGVSMADLRDYTGALRRQQAAAHGVAEGAASTSTEVGSKQIKLGGDANQASQEAVSAISECDQNLVDADSFLGDITSFEAQLAEEKQHAQQFITQVRAAAHAQQDRAKAEAAQHATEEAQHAQSQAAAGAQSAEPAAAPTPSPVEAAPAAGVPHEQADPAESAEPVDGDATEQIHGAIEVVSAESESMVSQLETRGDDYINQLAIANAKGRAADGTDLRAPAKAQSKKIVEEFKHVTADTKTHLAQFAQMSIDPSSARKIADTVIQAADHLDSTFDASQNALDELFSRTYNAIRAGRDDAAANQVTAAASPAAHAAPAAAPPS